MLDCDKVNKINDAEDKIEALELVLKDLADCKDNTLEYVAQLKDEISDAKMSASKDPELMARIKEMEGDLRQAEKELKDIERKQDELTKKKDELKK